MPTATRRTCRVGHTHHHTIHGTRRRAGPQASSHEVASFQSLDGRQAWTTGEMDWDAANAITFTGGRYRDACVGASGRFGLTCCWAVITITACRRKLCAPKAMWIRVPTAFQFHLFVETVLTSFEIVFRDAGSRGISRSESMTGSQSGTNISGAETVRNLCRSTGRIPTHGGIRVTRRM